MLDPTDVLRLNNHEPRQRWSGPPTEMERKIVYSYAAYGATDQDIANVLKMGEMTLLRNFAEELKEGRSNAKSKIAQRIYQVAVGSEEVKNAKGEIVKKGRPPNLTALIFLAKVRLGWKEVSIVETKETKESVQIFIPHNGRMKEDSIIDIASDDSN